MLKKVFFLIGLLVITNHSFAQKSWDGGAGTNNWGDAANWLPDGVPALTDNVTIGSGLSINIIVNVNAQCNNLSFSGIAANTSISLNSGITLNVAGTITFVDPTAAASQTIAAGDGTLTCSAVTMANTTNATETNYLTLNNGSITVNGNITTNGAANENYVTLTGNGTLNLGGSLAGGTFDISGTGSTVRWFGDNTNFRSGANYYHLIVQIPASAAANRTRQVTAATVVGGNLTIESLHPTNISILDANNQDFIVNGTTTINARGRFYDGSNTGTNTFIGNVLVQANGEFTNNNNNSPFVFQNGVNNNGTFTLAGSGAVTFSTNTQTIQGTQPLTLGNGAVNISGAITVTNNTTVTINGALDGNNASSLWTNGNSSILNYSNTTQPFNTNGGWDVNTNANTVNYNGGNQNIRSGGYNNLTFSNNNTKTLTGITNVNQLFTVSGTTAIACGVNNLNLLEGVTYTGTGTITTGANAVTYNSATAQDIIPGTYSGTLSLSSGAKTLKGVTTVNGAFSLASDLATGNNNLTLGAGVTYTSGNLTTGTNTVFYTASSAQNIIPATYSTLSLTGAGTVKTLLGATAVNAAFTLNITGVSSLACGTNNLTLSGTVTHTVGTFTTGANVVTYNGVGAQNILVGTYSGDLVTSGGAKTLTGAVAVSGNFQMGANLACAANTLTLSGGVTYTSGTFSSTGGTVNYNGAVAQNIISGSIGGAFSFSGGDKTLIAGATPLVVAGAVTMNANFNCGNNNVTLNGQQTWISGTLTNSTNSFTYGGAAAQNIIGANYNNLTLSGAGAKTLTVANTVVNGDISMASSLACGLFNLTLNGLINYTSGTITSGANVITYGRTGDQNVIPGTYSGSLVFAGNGNRLMSGAANVPNAITVPTGIILGLNGFTLTTSNNVTINAGGELDVLSSATASAQLLLANGRILDNSGVLKVVGNATYPAIITRNTAGNYSITQSGASAVFHAKYYQFNYLNGGINITNGSIDATNNFSNGSFSNGTGTQSLTINIIDVSGLSNITNVTFNAGPTYNVTRNAGNGALNFDDAAGVLAGENFDNDDANPGTRINWTYPATTYYSNPLGTFMAGKITDWTRNADGTGANPPSLTDGSATLVIQNGHTVTLDATNGNINVKELQVGQGTSGALVIGSDATQRTLTIQSRLDIKAGASVSAGTIGAPYHIIQLYGNLYNAGALSLNNAGKNTNIEVYGNAVSMQGAGSFVLNDITFKAASNSSTTVPLTIKGNVYLETTATFSDGNQTLMVTGSWNEAGSGKRTGNGTVVLNGAISSINNTTGSTGCEFYNLTFSGGGAGAIGDAVTIYKDFLVTNNTTVQVNNYAVLVAGNFAVDAGSTYQHTANTTTLNGTTAQALNVSGSAIFSNLFFTNGPAAKTVTGSLTAAGQVAIMAGATSDGNANFTMAGGLRLDGMCNWSGSINFTGGTIQSYNAGAAVGTLGTALVKVNGNVYMGFTAPATGFQLNVANDVLIQTGYLVFPNFTLLNASVANTFNMDVNTNLYMRGVNNFPTGFGTYALAPSTTVHYDWNLDQTVRGGITYGNVDLNDNGSATLWTKTADNPINIIGSLSINGGIKFSLNNNPLTVTGNIYNRTTGSIDGPTSTVTLNATDANQTIQYGIYNFRDLDITLDAATTSRTKTIESGTTLTLNGNFTVSNLNGTPSVIHIIDLADNNLNGSPTNWTLGTYCQINTSNAAFGPNFTDKFTGTKALDINSTVYYSLNGAQTLASGFSYGNITFNTGTKTAVAALDINGNVSGLNGPLFVDGGFTHTVGGNWNLGTANYTAASATGTIILDGADQNVVTTNFRNLIVSNSGTVNQIGTVNILGNFTINNNAKYDASTQAVNLYGNWTTPGNGIFTQTTGTLTAMGATNQTIATNSLSTIGNLTINKPNSVGNQTVTILSDLVVAGTITPTTDAGVIDISNQKVRIGGRLYQNPNSIETGLTFIATNSTVYFDGALTQYIYNNNVNPLTFNNVEFSNTGPKLFGWNGGIPGMNRLIDFKGNVTINGTAVNSGGWTYACDFNVAGNWANNGSFTQGAGNITTFYGTDQTISSSAFGSLAFVNSGTKTLTGNVTAYGSLTISGTATLDPGSNNINVSGNWDNSAPGAIFNSTAGTVIFEGASATVNTGTITGPAAGKSFNNVIVNKVAGNVLTLTGDMEIKGDLSLNSGYYRTNGLDVWLAGNLFNNGGILDHNNNASLLTFNSTGGNKTFDPGPAANLRGIRIAAPGTTYTVMNNFTISQNQDFTLDDGYFDLNGHTLQLNTNNQRIVINNGTFDIDASSTVTFNGTTQAILNNGGVLKVVGTSTQFATINRLGGTYTITQTAGMFHAAYYKVDYTAGITISGGGIDATNNFSDGTFSSGTGAFYLNTSGLDLGAGGITISNTVFNNGPTYNIRRLAGNGLMTFADATGTLSGETFDDDAGNPGNVIWTTPGGFYWDGGAGTDNWNDALNWSGDVVPNGTNNVYLNHKFVVAAYTVRITSANASAGRVILDAQGGTAITLQLENGRTLDVNGSVVINTNTTLNVTSPASTINVAGNWSNVGTFNHGNSSVIFDGATSFFTIATGGNGAGRKFNNLTINSPGSTYALTAALDCDNNLTVNGGNLDLASPLNDVWVGGDWFIDVNNGATINPNQADVTFDGVNQSITNGPFYNFLTAGSGTKTVNSNLAISGSVTLGAGTTLNGLDKNIFVAVNWNNNGATLTQTGLGAINFNGTGGQAVDNGTAATTFNNIEFYNGGTKTLNKSITVNGEFGVNPGSGLVDAGVYQITGNGTNTFIIGNGTSFRIRAANNFPNNFANVNLSTTSTVQYFSDVDQTIRVSPSWSYGNLYLADATNLSAPSTKTAQAGNLTITGSLTIADVRTLLDMNANSANMILTGNINFPTGGIQINWGTGTSILTHIGINDWVIDRDITGFNNLILAGYGNKWTQGDLVITGNVLVKNGVYLRMQEGWGPPPVPHTMTGMAGKTFQMENGAYTVCSTGSATSPAFPMGFGTYALGVNSTTILNGYVDQTIYTGNGIIYGNLDLSTYSRNVTMDGVANLDVNGYFNSNAAILFDNGKNISVGGAYAYLNYYTPTAGTTVTMDGIGNQTLYDGATNGTTNTTFDFANVVFSGSGTKTFGDGNDVINITGNFSNAPGVTVTSGRNINFTGTNWDNRGIFQHTGGTITFNQAVAETINPGPANALNYFNTVTFSGAGTKTFVNYGADINNTFTITDGTVDMGAFTHKLAGNIINNTGGTWVTSLANLTFDGGNQNINTPALTAVNINISTNGTKRLFSNWTVNGDLTINNLTALNTSDGINPSWDINVRKNWVCNGTFTCNTSKVTFDGNTSPVSITTNGSNFYNVEFNPSMTVQYNLLSPLSRISRAMDLRANATLNLNSQTLILGSNIAAGKVYTVEGTINVNDNAFLKFNSQTSQSVMNVTGRLNLIGSNSTNIATITREVGGVAGSEAQINILSGGTMAAQYYLIEYLQDAGLIFTSGSILDPVNNFSNGKFSNIRAAANVCYINLEADYTGGTISNICFDFAGTPVQGTHFNVRRNVAAPAIQFAQVSGNLGSYLFEDDDQALPAAATGLLRWPALTNTTWIGGLSTDWHTAGNWSNGVPTLLLDAIIPRGTPNDPSVFNADAVCKNLNITNGRLSLDNNRSLTSSGDMYIGGAGTNNGILAVVTPGSQIICGGFWTRGTSGMFVHGNGTVRFVSSAGTANITPLGSPFYNMVIDNPATTFYLFGGNPSALTVKGSVTINNGTLTPATNAYTYNIEGDFTVGTGTFTPIMGAVATGTVAFTGTGNQNITNATFYNLDILGSTDKATHGPVVINNQTRVNSILRAEPGSNITFNGNVIINAGGTFNDGDEIHTFNGTTWTGTGAYAGNGTVVFARNNGNQTINPSKFNNLDINCQTRNLYLAGDVNITGDVTIRAGVPNVYFANYLLQTTSAAGNFTVESNSRLSITGADNFPAGFSNYDLDLNSNTYYEGTGDQLVAGLGYGNLYLQYTNLKTLKGDIGVSNTLNFGVSTLDVSPNNYNINLTGTWNNNSTGTFIPRYGEVTFSGATGNQNIYINTLAVNPFWNLTIDKASGDAVAASNVIYQINNNLVVNNGRFNANGRQINVANDLLAYSGTFAQNGTYVMTKPSGIAHVQSNGSIFNNFKVDAGTATVLAVDNMRVDGNFDLANGTFDGNGKRIVLGYNYNTIDISGVYKVGAGGSIELGYYCTLTVQPGGTIEVIGAPGTTASVTRNANNFWVGGYRFTVNGTIKAKYALFEYMYAQTEGIYISSTGTIDPVNNFSYSTFNNGTTTGAMLTVENTQDLTGANVITDVSFPINPGGSGRNVRKTIATSGTIEFYNAVGTFAGENFDNDPFNLINWTGPITLTWNGSISTDWFNASNWTASSGPGFVPTGAENVFIAPAINQPIITTFGATTAHLTINPSATLTLNTPADGGVTDLTINGDIIINGTLREVSDNDYLSVKGNWTRTGNTLLSGNIIFDGSGASRFINNGNFPFYNITIAGATTYKIANGTIIKNDVNIQPGGQFEIPAWATIYVGGNWTNQGSFNATTSRVVFNATSGVKNIDGGASAFFDLDINAGTTCQISGTLSVMRTLNVNGTFNLNGKVLNAGDGVGVDYANVNGILNVDANSSLRLGAGTNLQVNTGGLLNILGTDASNVANVTCQTASSYAFEVASGGTLAARFYNIRRLNANGLYMRSGSMLDPVNNLSDGTFEFGTAGGTYLKFENDFGGSTTTISDVSFNAGPTFNVTRLTGTDMVFMRDAAGTMGTFLQENDQTGIPDPNTGLIHWTYVNTYIWTGAVDRNWHNPGNWMTNLVPDNTKSAIIPQVLNEPLISIAAANAKRITLYANAYMDINNQPVTLAEDIINDGIISVTGSPIITIAGNWNGTTGTFNAGNSKVVFNATGGNKTIFLGTGSFYDFEINAAATAMYQFGALTQIRHNLGIVSGQLDGSAYDLTVGGYWDVTGTFIPGLKTVTLNASSGSNILRTGANSFNNLTIYSGNGTGTATYTMASAINVTKVFTLRKGTLDVSNDGGATSNNITIGNRSVINGGTLLGRASLITVGENWQVSSPGVFTCGTSTVVVNSASGTRSITPGSSPFNNLTVNTGGTYRISNHTTVNGNLVIQTGTLDVSVSPTYNITVGGNWTNSGVFVPQIGTVTFNGVTQTITKPSGEVFNRLTVTNNTALTLANNVSVKDIFTLSNATITTGSNTLTIGISAATPGSLSYTAGKVIGKLERWIAAAGTYRFPLGSATNVNIADVTVNSGLTNGSLLMEFVPLAPGNAGLPLSESGLSLIGTFTEGHWNATARNGLAVGNFSLSMQGNGFVSNSFNDEVRVLRRNNSGSWALDGTHTTSVSPWAYRNNLTVGISTLGTQFCLAYMDCMGGQVASSVSSLCANLDVPAFTSATLAKGAANNFTYTWQYSANTSAVPGDASWTDLPTSNTPGYNYGLLTQTMRFVRKATGVGCASNKYSNTLDITMNPLPVTGPVYRKPNN